MPEMTRDICPSCGAWLILAEVQYWSPRARARGNRDTDSCLVYECQACRSVFQRWMRDDEPLLPMGHRDRSLRARVSAWRHVSEV